MKISCAFGSLSVPAYCIIRHIEGKMSELEQFGYKSKLKYKDSPCPDELLSRLFHRSFSHRPLTPVDAFRTFPTPHSAIILYAWNTTALGYCFSCLSPADKKRRKKYVNLDPHSAFHEFHVLYVPIPWFPSPALLFALRWLGGPHLAMAVWWPIVFVVCHWLIYERLDWYEPFLNCLWNENTNWTILTHFDTLLYSTRRVGNWGGDRILGITCQWWGYAHNCINTNF